MAHSYVDFGGKSVLMKDSQLYLVVYAIIAQCIHSDHKPSEDIAKLVAYWRRMIEYFGPGCVLLELDEYLKSDMSRKEFVSLALEARDFMLSQGEIVDGDWLRGIIGDETLPFEKEIKSDLFRNAFDRFLTAFE